MNAKHFRTYIDTLYNLTKYPVSLLDESFHVLCTPSNFLALPRGMFSNYKLKAKNMLQEKQLFYMLYEHGYFYTFLHLHEHKGSFLFIGPILLNSENAQKSMQENGFFEQLKPHDKTFILDKLPFLQENFATFFQLIHQNILNVPISIDELSIAFRQELEIQTENRLQQLMSRKRELDTRDYNYSDEVKLLHYIRQGDAVSARILATKVSKGRLGQLSRNGKKIPLYAFIALTTLISHTAMDCGVDIETAYGLNDLYIQKADEVQDKKEFQELCIAMIVDFCLLVKQKTRYTYPAWIQQTMNYIALNLHQTISLEMIGNEVHMLPSYMSVQFKKITGNSLMNYIQSKKIEEAAFLLRSTSQSIQEISTLLAFSSQAYFSTIFKKEMKLSPKTYRNNPYHAITNS